MDNLWSSNTPARFWLPEPGLSEEQWEASIKRALPVLELPDQPADVDQLLGLVLGEGRFGSGHWQLSPVRRLYYMFKPILPRVLTGALRRANSSSVQTGFELGWPVEDRYAFFQWEVMRQLLIQSEKRRLRFKHFWPEGNRFAVVLTHDVESAAGQAYVRAVADLDESFGFRSSFNFVPERYDLDHKLIDELRRRGFEIGVHGLKHDGKLFSSRAEFMRRAERINQHLKALGAVGFRAPLMHRQPEWMQALDIEYDLSFFDTDPFEPIPGGVTSVWPFHLGRFVELPYTLVQDYTLTNVLGENSARLWLEKVEFIKKYCGLVLVNTHPDYLVNTTSRSVYVEFLSKMKQQDGYWHALPRDAARWWRARTEDAPYSHAVQSTVFLDSTDLVIRVD